MTGADTRPGGLLVRPGAAAVTRLWLAVFLAQPDQGDEPASGRPRLNLADRRANYTSYFHAVTYRVTIPGPCLPPMA
jgi:hypothetical protein